MYCWVLLQHHRKLRSRPTSSRKNFQECLKATFALEGLGRDQRITWKEKSERFKNLISIEDTFIWGNIRDDMNLIYGLMIYDNDKTCIWIEHKGSNRTFIIYKEIIENCIGSINKSQGKWRKLRILDSAIFERNEENHIGIKAKFESKASQDGYFPMTKNIIGQFILATLILSIFLIISFYTSDKNLTLFQFLSSIDSYKSPTSYSFMAILVILLFVAVYRLITNRAKVTFHVE